MYTSRPSVTTTLAPLLRETVNGFRPHFLDLGIRERLANTLPLSLFFLPTKSTPRKVSSVSRHGHYLLSFDRCALTYRPLSSPRLFRRDAVGCGGCSLRLWTLHPEDLTVPHLPYRCCRIILCIRIRGREADTRWLNDGDWGKRLPGHCLELAKRVCMCIRCWAGCCAGD